MKEKYNPEIWQELGQNSKKDYAINCWHMSNYESAAMWKLYSKSNEGIVIQSTYNRLVKCFDKSSIKVHIGIVTYVDYEKDIFNFGNVFSPFLHKRKSFEHEKELRCVIWKWNFNNPNLNKLEKGGVKIEIDIKELIGNIYVSPDSPIWFTELVKDITRKYDIPVPIINSRLNDKPLF